MDYSKLSDNKINAEVALHWLGRGNFGLMNGAVEKLGRIFEPCNNPADAWPIIVANRIALMPDASEHGAHQWWDAQSSCRAHGIQYQANPLRAAMICYLMMQESE
ncbi:phage protein NinX family protein [Pantoea sp. 1.19]|uniref:phage protein NinX family protein n=1 Tax=Pantoea sp. 1.19 TaxID=1925589 RepID=UPI000948E59D|nr:phage protein NinX family protein [Pantoea sp. 1.19]